MKNILLSTLLCAALPFVCVAQDAPPTRIDLKNNWSLQSGCKVSDTGDHISTTNYHPHAWYSTSVPATVVAAQVANGQFGDPYEKDNLRKIPGTEYPVGKIFSRLAMSKTSPYACSWWYRTAFMIPASFHGETFSLHFEGINYRANIWINGKKLADSANVAGAYRRYEFDATALLETGKQNVLAVEVFAPTETDLGINWVDWNPAPPDKDMGLWRGVYLTASGPITLRYPTVTTHFTDNSLATAELTVIAELHNSLDHTVTAIVDGEIEAIHVSQAVDLKPFESRTVRFTPQDFPQLRLSQPRIWWPVRMGNPELYKLTLRASVDGNISEQQQTRFGIREITSELTDAGFRLFRVNGKPILIRGGGWAPDMLLRESHQRLVDEFRYVRHLGLNAIRLEGKLENDDFFNLADKQGILIIAGWCCCDHWEQWKKWQSNELEIATASLRSQILRLRSHPSLLVWLNGSDGPPPADVETAYIKELQDASWPNPFLSSASATPTTVTGRSGVKMTGPYDYVPPSYWLADTSKLGGAYGFNTETSPGPAIPPAQCMRKMIGSEHLWPRSNLWNFHAGSGNFNNTNVFDAAMNATYGAPTGIADYERKAQTMAYDGERAMFEAYSRNKYNSTGVVQWMLNNAWPSTIWHLYDYYLQPAGGYFGARKANEPLHIQYSYDNQTIAVVNNSYEATSGLKASAHLYDFDLHELYAQDVTLDLPADSVKQAFTFPAEVVAQQSQVRFIKLELHDNQGSLVSTNFYWIPQHFSEFDWAASDFKVTPVRSYEDMTALNHLPPAHLQARASVIHSEQGDAVRVTLTNSGKTLAFQVHLGITRPGSEDEILPVLWDDNYLALMPGESRTVLATLPDHKVGNAVLRLSGWNVSETLINITQPARQIATKEDRTSSQ